MNDLSRRRTAFPFSSLLAAMVGIAATAAAQCTNPWQVGDGLPGFDFAVRAKCFWDPDGAGPLAPRLVFGGEFTLAGDVAANRIVAWDPATGDWFPFGAGFNGDVQSLLVRQNGELIAAGRFTGHVARWTGAAWQTLGSGMSSGPTSLPEVRALAELPNGELIAGGSFSAASGVIVNSIARWNGVSWSALGSGVTTGGLGNVDALAVMANGDLVAAGRFFSAGGNAVNNIARWNGFVWSGLGGGLPEYVRVLSVQPNGDLVAGGGIGNLPVTMSRWNGTTWSAFGVPLGAGFVESIELLPGGDLVAGGTFALAGSRNIARWNGSSWLPLGAGVGGSIADVATLATLPGGDVIAAGRFVNDYGVTPTTNAARWNGAAWSPIAPGFDGVVRAAVRRPDGNVVVTGSFATAGGAFSSAIAEWNGAAWQPLGAGFGFNHAWNGGWCLANLPNGELVVGGAFVTAGGVNAANIARWDGTAWHALGAGLGGTGDVVRAVAVLPNGDVVAGASAGGQGAMNIARWNGVAWSPLGGFDGPVWAFGVLSNGDLVATGVFHNAGGVAAESIARWNGTTWSPFGSGLTTGGGSAIAVEPGGAFVVGGSFTAAGGIPAANIARWDGATWSALGSGMANGIPWSEVAALVRHDNGNLIAAGAFTVAGGVANVGNIARWNGTAWSSFGVGTDDRVHALAQFPSGDVFVGGAFRRAGGAISAQFATLTTTCPASVQSVGAGCAGAGGVNVLASTTPPWTGTTFRATATGMPTNAFVLAIWGFTPLSVPISALIPLGLPGCSVHVTSDYADVLLPVAGTVQTQLALPNSATLAGLVLRHYVAPFELDPMGALQAITSSNALSLTIGTF